MDEEKKCCTDEGDVTVRLAEGNKPTTHPLIPWTVPSPYPLYDWSAVHVHDWSLARDRFPAQDRFPAPKHPSKGMSAHTTAVGKRGVPMLS